MKNFDDLKKEYFNILSALDSTFFDKNISHTKYDKENGLSGLFLPSQPDNYFNAKNKIMIIGAETRGWDVLGINEFIDLPEYINLSINKQKLFFEKQLLLNTTGKITFHDFTRQVSERSGKEGLLYCNLFCFSWKMKSPMNTKYFEQIHNVSEKLLRAQVEFFQPEIIIFANGLSSVKYRREIFPLDKCKDTVIFESESLSKNQLWQFNFDDKYLCYRIQHPSTIKGRADAKKARNKLMQLLPSK